MQTRVAAFGLLAALVATTFVVGRAASTATLANATVASPAGDDSLVASESTSRAQRISASAAAAAELQSALMSLSLPAGKRRLDDINTASSNAQLEAALLAGAPTMARNLDQFAPHFSSQQFAASNKRQSKVRRQQRSKHSNRRAHQQQPQPIADNLSAFPSNQRLGSKKARGKSHRDSSNTFDDDADKDNDADTDDDDDDSSKAQSRSSGDDNDDIDADNLNHASSANDRFFQDDDSPTARKSTPVNYPDSISALTGQPLTDSPADSDADADSDGDSDVFASRSDFDAANKKLMLQSLAASSGGKKQKRGELSDEDSDSDDDDERAVSPAERKSSTSVAADETDDADVDASNASTDAVPAPSQLSNVRSTSSDLATAAAGHHGHGGHYYQHVEVPKKKAWKFGFKRGNHKHEIARHEKGYKHKFHSEFHWHAKEKCKKKKKCKSVGSMKWEYKHAKKHHG